jgi:hypothetical protein
LRLKEWNEEVLALADEFLPIREAAQVDALALSGWTSVVASSVRVDRLIQNNSATLDRIRWIEQARGNTRPRRKPRPLSPSRAARTGE